MAAGSSIMTKRVLMANKVVAVADLQIIVGLLSSALSVWPFSSSMWLDTVRVMEPS